MALIRTFHYLLLVTALFYFLTCPTVHKYGEDVQHDLLPKIEVEELKTKTKKGLDLNFVKLSQDSYSKLFHYRENAKEFLIDLSQRFIPNLPILSTTRLIM